MSSSAIVAVRKALVDAVAALDAFQSARVMFAYQPNTERVAAFTQRATFNHKPAAMKSGRNNRAEAGRFEFVILVQAVGLSPEDASQSALDYGLAFEEYVADHKQGLGGAYTLTIDGDGSLTELVNDRASLAELVYPVKFDARLT